MKYLKNFYKYRYLLYEIVRKNIKLQYRNSVLGIFWTFLQPLMTTIVLVLVFLDIGGDGGGLVWFGVQCGWPQVYKQHEYEETGKKSVHE